VVVVTATAVSSSDRTAAGTSTVLRRLQVGADGAAVVLDGSLSGIGAVHT
jgi:hypothetical protein